MSEEKALSTLSVVKELTENAKKVKAQKEAVKFLVKAAKKYREIEQMKKDLTKYAKDNELGTDLLKEAKTLSDEDIEALDDLLDEGPTQEWGTPMGVTFTNGTITSN